MIQRSGRVDRLGSPHEAIHIANIFPDAELETLLRLVERLQTKLSAINETIGLDASVLGELITPRTLNTLRELAAGDDSSLAHWAQVSELTGNEMMRQQLLAYLRQYGAALVQGLPSGIHSSLQRGQRQGVFAYYRHNDRHFWRFYDTLFEIHELIRAMPGETRADDILATLEEQRGAAALGQSLDTSQRALAQVIKAGWDAAGSGAQAQTLFTALRPLLPATFTTDMRSIHARYKQDGDYSQLVAAVQTLFDHYQLANSCCHFR